MAEYLPRFTPGTQITFTAMADMTGGQLVMASGFRGIAVATVGAASVVGVVGNDVKSGQEIVVYAIPGHVHWVTAAGAIKAGDQIVAAANGQVAAGTTNTIGVALKDATVGGVCEFIGR